MTSNKIGRISHEPITGVVTYRAAQRMVGIRKVFFLRIFERWARDGKPFIIRARHNSRRHKQHDTKELICEDMSRIRRKAYESLRQGSSPGDNAPK